MRLFLFRILLGLVAGVSVVASLMAQSTAVYEESYRRFEDGLQLLEKNLYPAAQICFF
ncbi:MAG: hypothetical protein HC913_07390 [Microscillaceae bacterium]|nr:hypothetical protein [Microscillaceae bacterium]